MNVGSILRGAFALIRERPGAVAVWGLIYLATDDRAWGYGTCGPARVAAS